MSVVDQSEYVLCKAMAEYSNEGLKKPLYSINSKCLSLLEKYNKYKTKFMNCDTYETAGDNSVKYRKIQEKLNYLMAIQNRLESIKNKNDERLQFIDQNLKKLGIYNTVIDKKKIFDEISKESKNINEQTLNFGGDFVYKFFEGEILAFKDDRIDFSIDFNQDVLLHADADFIHKLIFTFPYCVGSIPDEMYFYSDLKNKILRECILFVSSNIKVQSIKESNRELGGLLCNAGNIQSVEQYANELKNYFNVSVNRKFKDYLPDLTDDIDHYLRVNAASEFLPASKKVAVLANGIAGDVPKIEEEESEEVRKEKEQELFKQVDEILSLITEEKEDNKEKEAVKEVGEDKIETAINENKQIENQSKQQDEKEYMELELQLQKTLKNNDTWD